MKNLKLKLVLALTILMSSFSMAMPSLALNCASPQSPKDQIQCGACSAAGATSCNPGGSSTTISDTIKKVINIISVFAGAIAVLMIIIGGFRYVTSAGNAEATKSARSTIVYAVVGLVIIALAQIIVHFVLNNISTDCVNGKTSSGQKCTP